MLAVGSDPIGEVASYDRAPPVDASRQWALDLPAGGNQVGFGEAILGDTAAADRTQAVVAGCHSLVIVEAARGDDERGVGWRIPCRVGRRPRVSLGRTH